MKWVPRFYIYWISCLAGVIVLAPARGAAEMTRSWDSLIAWIQNYNSRGTESCTDLNHDQVRYEIVDPEIKDCVRQLCKHQPAAEPGPKKSSDRLDKFMKGKEDSWKKDLLPLMNRLNQAVLAAENAWLDDADRVLANPKAKLDSPTSIVLANLSLHFQNQNEDKDPTPLVKIVSQTLGEAVTPAFREKAEELRKLSDTALREQALSLANGVTQNDPAADYLTQYSLAMKNLSDEFRIAPRAMRLDFVNALANFSVALDILRDPSKFPAFTTPPPPLNELFPQLKQDLANRRKRLDSDVKTAHEKCLNAHLSDMWLASPRERGLKIEREFKEMKETLKSKFLGKLSSASAKTLAGVLDQATIELPVPKEELQPIFSTRLRGLAEVAEFSIKHPGNEQTTFAALYSRQDTSPTPMEFYRSLCRGSTFGENESGLADAEGMTVKLSSDLLSSGIYKKTMVHELFHILDPKMNLLKLSAESQGKLNRVRGCIARLHPPELSEKLATEDWADEGAAWYDVNASIQSSCYRFNHKHRFDESEFQKLLHDDHSSPHLQLLRASRYLGDSSPKSCDAVIARLSKKKTNVSACFDLF